MGVEDTLPDNSSIPSNPSHVTVQDLINHHGEEIVKRGLSYMESLRQADKNYRGSGDPDELKRGYDEGGVNVQEDEQKAEEITSRWAEAMNEKGLGIR